MLSKVAAVIVFVAFSLSVSCMTVPAGFLGVQHFQPCYYINSTIPCLLDGAVLADAHFGARLFKFALKQSTPSMYPFNNFGRYAWPTNAASLTEMASTLQIRDLLGNKLGTKFDTFVIWAYSLGLQDSYWCNSIDATQEAEETQQFSDLTYHLLTNYSGVSFYLEHWEGDWAARCRSYDRSVPPTAEVAVRMTRWLAARQYGVNDGRARYAKETSTNQHQARVGAAVSNVYHGSEVNLVLDSIHNVSFGNIIRSVIPHVALDTVSYSCYEAQANATALGEALDFIFASMNRSAASPALPVFITEFGSPLNLVSETEAMMVATGVIQTAVAKHDKYLRMVFHWQLINNELVNNSQCITAPSFNAEHQSGFWEVLPDGTLSYIGKYLQSLQP